MASTWKSINWAKWGGRAMAISDWAGNHANNAGAKFGTERFWPTSGDYILELEKCERILRTFTVEGLPTEEEVSSRNAEGAPVKKKRKVYRKIPPKVIQDAKGLVIFNAMRSGIAPFSGAGGGGVIVVRMKDGSWSPPSFISPNNFGAGLMFGLDVYQCILVLRSDEAVKGFRTHNLTIGTEMAVAAGPLGYGISGDVGLKDAKGQGFKTPIFSYVLSKGFFAGVEVVGQAFIDRFDENERVYFWTGIKAGDIFDGKVRRPPESAKFFAALRDAEMGVAQGANLEWDTEEVTTLDLDEGEVLKLPPTPEQLQAWESAGIKDEEDAKAEEEERKIVRSLPPPPRHPHAMNYRARTSDGSQLSGRTAALRSTSMGYSPSNSIPSSPLAHDDNNSNSQTLLFSSSPDLQQITPSKFEQSTTTGGYLSPPVASSWTTADQSSDQPEPLHVPPVLSANGATEESIVPEAQREGLGLVIAAEEQDKRRRDSLQQSEKGDAVPNFEHLNLNGEKKEDQGSLAIPKLQHHDSETSMSSVSEYGDAISESGTEIPPPPIYTTEEPAAK